MTFRILTVAIILLTALQAPVAMNAQTARTSNAAAASPRYDTKAEAQMKNDESAQAAGRGPQTQRTRAEATITVESSQATPYDKTVGPALMELRLTERFAGDIEGESAVRAIQLQRADKTAAMVSMQRVRGKLAGRSGTFVLQGSETVGNGMIKATWFVVPGSGTGELTGLRGEGGFEGQFGKGSKGTLDYWFE